MLDIPDIFYVKGQNECSPHIYRISCGGIGDPRRAVFRGQQDTEALVLRAVLIYIQQESIDSRIFCDDGLRPFIEEFGEGYKVTFNTPDFMSETPPRLLRIPHLGQPRIPALEVIRPIPDYGAEHVLSICEGKLVFVQYDNPLGAFTVAPQEADPLIKAIFVGEDLRTRPYALAKLLDIEYALCCSRRQQSIREP